MPNPSIERARLFAFLFAENPTTLPVSVETAGEIQLVVSGPGAGDRRLVQLKPQRIYELLNEAPISWWQTTASVAELSKAINNGWLSVPVSGSVPQAAPVSRVGEEVHQLVLWEATQTPQVSPAGKARMHFDGSKLLISENGGDFIPILQPEEGVLTLTYAATVNLNFSPAENPDKMITLTGNVIFTSSGLYPKRAISLLITDDGSGRSLTFPAGWIFLGTAAPASIGAGKKALLSLTAYGLTDADVVAAYAEQP